MAASGHLKHNFSALIIIMLSYASTCIIIGDVMETKLSVGGFYGARNKRYVPL